MICTPCQNDLHELCVSLVKWNETGELRTVSVKREEPVPTLCDCQHFPQSEMLLQQPLTPLSKSDSLKPGGGTGGPV